MSQDEDMDTSPLAQNQPFFMIDKEKGKGNSEESREGGDDSDGGQDEDLNSSVNEEQEEEDKEVSVSRKASTNSRRLGNGDGAKTNGNHLAESEESSEEEDSEEDKMDQTPTIKSLPSSTALCPTLAS